MSSVKVRIIMNDKNSLLLLIPFFSLTVILMMTNITETMHAQRNFASNKKLIYFFSRQNECGGDNNNGNTFYLGEREREVYHIIYYNSLQFLNAFAVRER